MSQDEIIQKAEEVFAVMQPRTSEQDMLKIRDAFALAMEAHEGQMRKGGDPYIVHPIAVAMIVAKELEQETNAVCAAFLHDVVEDTPHTVEDIRERFGDDVAFLVDVVTKRKKDNSGSIQVENFKQILDSVHYDIRALMIKLADRLHNMRTLDSMLPAKQMKIAGETDFFYAPLANRLGLYRIKSELENLSFRFRCPRDYSNLEQLLAEDKEESLEAVTAFTVEIDRILKENKIPARTEVRYRKPYSIWRDMQNKNVDFTHVEFKHYIRIIYSEVPGWNEKNISLYIYSALTDKFKERPGSVTNYIDSPKENGYQSFHVKLLSFRGRWEEIHISSERMLRNSRLGCIDKTNEESMRHWLDKLRGMLKEMAQTRDSESFMEGVSTSFYNEDIYVLTPKGRVILLPKGASALDFAYELHTDIGEHAQYARINGVLSSIKTELNRGDCVEIGTNPNVTPRPDWLGSVKTFKALRHLKNSLKGLPDNSTHRCKICNPLPGDEVIGFKEDDGTITMHTRHCPEAIRLASESGDRIVAVNFTPTEGVTYPVRISIVAVDRMHLLHDIIDCISDEHISMGKLKILTNDQIVTGTIDLHIESAQQLGKAIARISKLESVDEVHTVENRNN